MPLLVLLTWSQWASAALGEKLTVYTGNYPLAYFAERIGGGRVDVRFHVPAGVDPAYWRPDARTLAAMARADLILLNGADYEKWLAQATLPRLKLVDTSAAFKDRYIVVANAVTHSHGSGGEHAHDGLAFTTWLDFQQAAEQASAIAQALARKRPEWKSLFEANLGSLQQDLAELDGGLAALAARQPGRRGFASHPVYQYLARRYGLDLKSVHWEPEEFPTADEWQALRSQLVQHPSPWMLWEGTPVAETAARLKEIGLDVVVFDPCATKPQEGDFLSVMRRNLENWKHVWRKVD